MTDCDAFFKKTLVSVAIYRASFGKSCHICHIGSRRFGLVSEGTEQMERMEHEFPKL